MATVPVALNIFNNGKMWKTRRVAGVWEAEALWFTDPAVGPTGPQQFSANSVTKSLSNLSTLVFTSDGKLYFIDNAGTRILVGNITATSGSTLGFRPLSTQWDQYWGPFNFGGTYFFFGGIYRGSPGFDFRMAAYSGPQTGTATEENAVGSPVYGDGFTDNFGGSLGVYWDGVSQYVYHALIDPVSFYKVQIYRFDMTARTWSGVLATFDAGAFVQYIIFPERGRLVVFNNGDYGLVFSVDGSHSAFAGGTWYTFYNGSAWSAPVLVDADGTGLATIAFEPSLERVDVFTYQSLTLGKSQINSAVKYGQVTHPGVASVALATIAGVGSSDGANQGVVSVDAGVIAIPRDDQADPSNAIWECPVHGPYVFTKTILPIPASPGTQLSCAMIFYTTAPVTPPAIACPTQAAGSVGTPYASTVMVTGGVAPFSFAIASGSLPPGLNLNLATGVITGTPTLAGTFNFVIRVTDANSQTAATPGCPIVISQSATGPVCSACPLRQVITPALNVGTPCNPISMP